jgi:hypothetical protein
MSNTTLQNKIIKNTAEKLFINKKYTAWAVTSFKNWEIFKPFITPAHKAKIIKNYSSEYEFNYKLEQILEPEEFELLEFKQLKKMIA